MADLRQSVVLGQNGHCRSVAGAAFQGGAERRLHAAYPPLHGKVVRFQRVG